MEILQTQLIMVVKNMFRKKGNLLGSYTQEFVSRTAAKFEPVKGVVRTAAKV